MLQRTLRTIATAVGTIAVGATLAGCVGSSWTPIDLSKPGAVESIACSDLKAASDAKAVAVSSHDEKAQKTLGLLDAQGVLDQEKIRDIERRLGERAKSPECTGATTSVAKLANEQTLATVGDDGKVTRLPVVTGTQLVRGDSTKFRETPPLGSEADRQKCGLVKYWSQLVACMGDKQWYRDGFKTMAPYTASCGLQSWDDVVRFAGARVKDDKGVEHEVDARVIQVMNKNMTHDEARAIAREMIGDEANNLTVIDAHDKFTNSRGLEAGKISPFIDQKPQVRISLAPILFDKNGKVAELCGDAGVFIDCLNIWGVPRAVAPAPDKPVVCPPGTAMAGRDVPNGDCNVPPPTPPSGTGTPPITTPPTTPPPTTTRPPQVCVPPYPYGQWPNCKDGPSALPNTGNHGENQDSGPDVFVPPPQMTRPPETSRVNPQPPPPAPVPGATVAPSSQAPLPPAPGAPSPEAPAEGCAPAPGETSC